MTPTMLEALYNGSTTWITATPTTLPATTFSGDIALGVNNIKFINTSGKTRIVDRTLLETFYSNAGSWILASTLSGYSYMSSSSLTITLGSYALNTTE